MKTSESYTGSKLSNSGEDPGFSRDEKGYSIRFSADEIFPQIIIIGIGRIPTT